MAPVLAVLPREGLLALAAIFLAFSAAKTGQVFQGAGGLRLGAIGPGVAFLAATDARRIADVGFIRVERLVERGIPDLAFCRRVIQDLQFERDLQSTIVALEAGQALAALLCIAAALPRAARLHTGVENNFTFFAYKAFLTHTAFIGFADAPIFALQFVAHIFQLAEGPVKSFRTITDKLFFTV